MKKNFYPFMALLVLIMTALACASPFGGGGQPSSPNEIETIVAATFQALTPVSSGGETVIPAPVGLLPHSLYFINNDDAGIAQVFRLETDGKTVRQITFEPSAVGSYDVSQVDGSVAYVAGNQLLLIHADGSDRRVLFDGGYMDPNYGFINAVRFPAFSPNGKTIAYGYKGLNLYALDANVSNRVLEDDIDDRGNNNFFPREMYWPSRYSPDGTKLLITLGYYEGASAAIYYPAANSSVRLKGGEGALICCGEEEWTLDGSAFYSASPAVGMFNSGLWKVDTASGAVTMLISSNYETGSFNYADEPYLAPDGKLYYFFLGTAGEFNSRAPLQLVHSAPDGVTDRTIFALKHSS